MGNTDLIDNFYHLMLQVAEEEELLYQKKREEALKKNIAYSMYDKQTYLNFIEGWVKKEQHLQLWYSYFFHIAGKGLNIKDSEPVALEFFNSVVVPLIKSDAADKHPEYVKSLMAKLTNLGCFEEVLMINYYASIESYVDILAMTHTPSLLPMAKEIDGYLDFVYEHDPRR